MGDAGSRTTRRVRRQQTTNRCFARLGRQESETARKRASASAEFLTPFDTTLTPPKTQYDATHCKAEKPNRLI
jgi:hypothetical protein